MPLVLMLILLPLRNGWLSKTEVRHPSMGVLFTDFEVNGVGGNCNDDMRMRLIVNLTLELCVHLHVEGVQWLTCMTARQRMSGSCVRNLSPAKLSNRSSSRLDPDQDKSDVALSSP